MSTEPTTEPEVIVETEVEETEETDDEQGEQEAFPREYVEKLRKESAGYRDRAKDRDDLAHRLHTALVAATGRLVNADELPFDEGHLTDAEALTAAIDDLLASKPYLAPRKPSGDVGQGASQVTPSVDLGALLRSNA